ncbi:HalOD1 output domain-containing protein [Natronolimnobius baerhuensis]|uniref:Halobacterial output domain-containing protein n=1 Tax=Natronolimnobius baerhuensis TaxID=253108 RepID=A0A202E812_9EURY|nr:HalOD1 output domain-containing protein [Natronolimnobius baerhuensis]OVE84278.1 hypothetical protein B2G88_07625 [Natronolimnobius baerhuensis]
MTRMLETDNTNLSEQIVTAVATKRDTDPTDLPPLFDAVDPDALTAVFSPTTTGAPRTGRIEFPYAGHDIEIVFTEDETTLSVN